MSKIVVEGFPDDLYYAPYRLPVAKALAVVGCGSGGSEGPGVGGATVTRP